MVAVEESSDRVDEVYGEDGRRKEAEKRRTKESEECRAEGPQEELSGSLHIAYGVQRTLMESS